MPSMDGLNPASNKLDSYKPQPTNPSLDVATLILMNSTSAKISIELMMGATLLPKKAVGNAEGHRVGIFDGREVGNNVG
jgi:hypothetical protein